MSNERVDVLAFNHTPGPWNVVAAHWNDSECEDGDVSYVINMPGAIISKANARLIEAAPDLLEAAAKAISECVDLMATPAGEALSAAIAKARGDA